MGRDERFCAWWTHWYPRFAIAVLGIAYRVLPARMYAKLERIAVDTAEPMGKLAGWCYCNVRDTGDLIRWLFIGRAC